MILTCAHCGNKTPHDIIFEYSFEPKWYDDKGVQGEKGEGPSIDYSVARCQTCEDIALYSCLSEGYGSETLEFPKGHDLHESVPESVRTNYAEAKIIRERAPNAFAVMIRRALEAICDDKNVKSGNLKVRLKALADRGEIPEKLIRITDVLRELGNAGAHNTSQRVTVPLTWSMDEFFRVVVEYVYVAPSKLEDFEKKLIARKLKGTTSSGRE